jgi:hypothetical protein
MTPTLAERGVAPNRARATIRQRCHPHSAAASTHLAPGSLNLLEILRSPKAAELAGLMMIDHSREGVRS